MNKFDLVGFYGIATILGYSMLNSFIIYTYQIYTYDWEHILEVTFLNKPVLFFVQLNGFKYCYITVTI